MKYAKGFLLVVLFLASCAAPVTPAPTRISTPTSTPVPPKDFLQTSDAYLGQTPPGDVPVVFAPGIVSIPGKNTAALTFSPDGRQCIFYIEAYPNSYAMFTEFRDVKWTTPVKAWFSETRSVGEPIFSPDGKMIYFTSNEKKNSVGGFDLWYLERSGTSWSEPVNLGRPVNTVGDEFHPSPVADGSIYFTSNSGAIVRSQYENGKYLEPVELPEPINLKSNPNGKNWGDPYVSPDESYMIFKSNRPGGSGKVDNYITHRNADGSWSDPKNLGPTVNSASSETGGDISPDGKYMFFGRDGLIYWVRADFISTLH
jgi:Tol biopolymer transport system component